jgi:hypothetical protein
LAKISINSKDFKEVLKILFAFGDRANRFNTNALIVTLSPSPRFVLHADDLFVEASPTTQVLEDGPAFAFGPEVLRALSLTSKNLELSWTGPNSQLTIKDGNFTGAVNVAAKMPEFKRIQDGEEKWEAETVPLGALALGTDLTSIPFAYYKAASDYSPIVIKSENGKLCFTADDGFSMAKINFDIPVKSDFELKIPAFVARNLFKGVTSMDPTPVRIGYCGFSYALESKLYKVRGQALNDTTNDLDEALVGVLAQAEWGTSFDFQASEFKGAAKPLYSMIPAKDKSGSVIKVVVEPNEVFMQLSHPTVGRAETRNVPGIKNIYNEKSLNNYSVNMHPDAFMGYTELFSTVGEGRLYASNRAVMYDGEIKTEGVPSCRVRYLFPTVMT